MIHFLPSFWHLLPIFLYAETHYRFRYFFSLLRKREPEIIADAPHRIEPDSALPILILLKDAHLYPITIESITVAIQTGDNIVISHKLLESPVKITQKLWWHIFTVKLDGVTGKIGCDVKFEITYGKKHRFYHNDNHRTSSHRPLHIFISSSSLPRFEYLHFGECHSHSSYTDDQVEFGSPLGASSHLCRSLGLSFFCATDHSYDLDDSLHSYLVNDPEMQKWKLFQQEINELNSNLEGFVVVRGEEVTCRNSLDQNVHLLLLGNRKFFYGSGDSAERWLETRSEYGIDDILNILEPQAICFAAHPKEHVSFIQRLLLRRGTWSKDDMANPRLSGTQFVNGKLSYGLWEGYQQWKEILLQGRRMFMLAGNDAHGNFNYFRQICIPFLKMHESEHQLFGKMRTGVFLESLSEENILQAVRSGKLIVTDGPVVNILIRSSAHQITSIGQNIVGNKFTILVEALSSQEFGSIDILKVIIGKIGFQEETLFIQKTKQRYSINHELFVELEKDSYLRAEAWTLPADAYDNQSHFCFTNPVWLTRDERN